MKNTSKELEFLYYLCWGVKELQSMEAMEDDYIHY